MYGRGLLIVKKCSLRFKLRDRSSEWKRFSCIDIVYFSLFGARDGDDNKEVVGLARIKLFDACWWMLHCVSWGTGVQDCLLRQRRNPANHPEGSARHKKLFPLWCKFPCGLNSLMVQGDVQRRLSTGLDCQNPAKRWLAATISNITSTDLWSSSRRNAGCVWNLNCFREAQRLARRKFPVARASGILFAYLMQLGGTSKHARLG